MQKKDFIYLGIILILIIFSSFSYFLYDRSQNYSNNLQNEIWLKDRINQNELEFATNKILIYQNAYINPKIIGIEEVSTKLYIKNKLNSNKEFFIKIYPHQNINKNYSKIDLHFIGLNAEMFIEMNKTYPLGIIAPQTKTRSTLIIQSEILKTTFAEKDEAEGLPKYFIEILADNERYALLNFTVDILNLPK
jgi:hypothetical protein